MNTSAEHIATPLMGDVEEVATTPRPDVGVPGRLEAQACGRRAASDDAAIRRNGAAAGAGRCQ
jgi:hypothetical protein